MIKIKQIIIEEFRGIRNITLNFNNKNYTVCGPNGTGKSGIVDAIEFVLTGNVSRLSGEGTGDVSLKKHGPHVDSRNRPDKAKVSAIVFIPSLNKEATIERTVDDIFNPKISPNNPEILKVFDEVFKHPEFVLSRRELIRYIVSKPGKRSEEVQALLRLNKIDNFRKKLNTVVNSYKKIVPTLAGEKKIAGDQLTNALGITELKPENILEEVNKKRVLLGLEKIESLTTSTSLKDGLSTAKTILLNRFSKEQAGKDIELVKQKLENLKSNDTKKLVDLIIASIKKIEDDESIIKKATKNDNLFKYALDLLAEDKCPVCDTAWNISDLKFLIEKKRKDIQEKNSQCDSIKKEIDIILTIILEIKSEIESVKKYGSLLKPEIEVICLENYIVQLDNYSKQLGDFTPFKDTIVSLNNLLNIDKKIEEKIEEFIKAIEKIPKPTEQESARDYLIVAQEKFEHFKNISIRHKKSDEKAKLIELIYKVYTEVNDESLDKLYKDVEKQFSTFYQDLNKDDENEFSAKLIPSIGKLGFDVDFYGKGFFPPGAYHSEGHQDAMGLCLYLTLMKHILKENFNIAVLDDVLMSVDSGHRREVCSLLKQNFPNTQFIFTTHDDIWLKHMKTVGLVESRGSMLFRKWDVETGPSDWDDRDIWTEIETELDKNDIESSSFKLRHYLEYISKEICHKLRARVEFRGDALYQLGDLMPGATKAFSDRLNKAKEVANSWAQNDVELKIDEKIAEYKKLVELSKIEEWQINKSVHYNEWANLSKEDFKPVVVAFKNLLRSFSCENCNEMLYITPERNHMESLKCSCGNTNFNLKKKVI